MAGDIPIVDCLPKLIAEWAKGMAEGTKHGLFGKAPFVEDAENVGPDSIAKSCDDVSQGDRWLSSSDFLFEHAQLACLSGCGRKEIDSVVRSQKLSPRHQC